MKGTAMKMKNMIIGVVAALCVAKLFIDDVKARKLEVATLFQ